MNRAHIFIAIVMFTALGITLSAWAQPTAERTLLDRGYTPGESLGVSIAVTGEAGEVTVTETPPAGWTISDLMPSSGIVQNGVITWNTTLLASRDRVLSYKVTPPSTQTGEAVFAGMVDGQPIGGVTSVSPYEPEPLGVFE
ncbi:MAG: hypothetical protein ABIH23_23905, partial [bacterium]